MSEFAGLLDALKQRDEEASQSLIDKVHKAGGGKEEVQMNLKKMNKEQKEAKSQRPKTKRKTIYNSPYGYKKGGVTIKKKRVKFNNGGTNKQTAEFANQEAAIAARKKHIAKYRNRAWSGSFWATDHEGNKVVRTINYWPKGSDESKEIQSAIDKARKDKQIEEKRRQALLDAGYEEGVDF
tara:strand:+ start:219 stop:761 length:543 start_codon:yes stop_codon:yes gene_type:complete